MITKKQISKLIYAVLIVSMFLLCSWNSSNTSTTDENGSNEVTLIGKWERLNEVTGNIEYYRFSSDGTCTEYTGSSSNTANYSIDEDGTFHLYAGKYSDTLQKISVEEMLELDDSETSSYYAYNSEVLCFMDNYREFKRK